MCAFRHHEPFRDGWQIPADGFARLLLLEYYSDHLPNVTPGMVISLTGRAFPNSSDDIAECGIPDLLLRGLLAFAGFAVSQIDFGDISFLIVELGPDDRFAGF